MRRFGRRQPTHGHPVDSSGSEKGAANAEALKTGKCPLTWWQKLGFLGFMFFLIKGLLWLLIPAGLLLWRSMSGE